MSRVQQRNLLLIIGAAGVVAAFWFFWPSSPGSTVGKALTDFAKERDAKSNLAGENGLEDLLTDNGQLSPTPPTPTTSTPTPLTPSTPAPEIIEDYTDATIGGGSAGAGLSKGRSRVFLN